ncbi:MULTISPECIES: transcriptional regulator GutM [unclassified Clostridioides]|uniref:transcriptional regulator GutM n=1 Tax=unclassified Clostridioides TaxID=2635829 RepID=UPI001D1207C2|nr:hypothetical protein [Clostridioides sp. ZZV15-6388]MCC0642850.1 hypothetical protein [Clostridioides sp. ZZV14-6150]MCC0660203.1 hypothetical protein [Clostridioides sp. ZZV14-6154]MCC0664943.1 hypothetical protein [Clostridioides sp. ZZV15-6597]MCC0667390.1 hypothetical protein [Clostridioides sp. ZZV14-6153]MCC0717114.1 hypothetical protein [Clostridioides sp. ZZV14-6105]MCC0720998.1 hypothetical protein [Clostridioides sp. ZZV14-6104]MCC0725671.1 hypothetical protein [Clostridioides s
MKLLIILFVVYVLNTLFVMKQNKLYFKALNKAKKMGDIVSTGKKKSYFSKGSIAIISSDSEGFIKCGEILKGRTVMAKFKEIEDIKGLDIYSAEQKFKDEESIVQAIKFIKEKINISFN